MTDLIEVRACNLIGAPLNWAVAMAEGFKPDSEDQSCVIHPSGCPTSVSIRGATEGYGYRPSTNWAQGGPLIEKHLGSISYGIQLLQADVRYCGGPAGSPYPCYGPTALVAFCRSLVKTELGDIVQVPKELMP